MKLTVPLEVTKTVELEGYEPFDVTFRQPRVRDYLKREELWQQHSDDVLWGYIQAWDVYLTISECGIERPDGSPLWDAMKLKNHKLTIEEFMEGWEMLPLEIATALWETAMEVAPDWDWRGESFRKAAEEAGESQE